MKKKLAIFIITIVFLTLGGYWFFLFNNTKVDIDKTTTEISISSDKLLHAFHKDELAANAHFVEKAIEVSGTIEKINYLNNRYTVLLKGKDNDSYVLCDMLPSSVDSIQLLPGETVRLKGICKGYLMDVVMLNCILVNP